MKIILLIVLLSTYSFTSFADGEQNSSIYDKITKADAQKKTSQGVFEQEYDASKIKRKSRIQQANQKLLDGQLRAKEIEEEAKKKYGEDGLKSPKKVVDEQKHAQDQLRVLDEQFKKKKVEQK